MARGKYWHSLEALKLEKRVPSWYPRHQREMEGALGPAHSFITLLKDKTVVGEIMCGGDFRAATSEAALSGDGLHVARLTMRR